MNAWAEIERHYQQEPLDNIYKAEKEELQKEILRLRAALILAEEEFVNALSYEEHTYSCDNARRIIKQAIPDKHVDPSLKWGGREGRPRLRSDSEKAIQTVRVTLHRELQRLDRVLEKFIDGGKA